MCACVHVYMWYIFVRSTEYLYRIPWLTKSIRLYFSYLKSYSGIECHFLYIPFKYIYIYNNSRLAGDIGRVRSCARLTHDVRGVIYFKPFMLWAKKMWFIRVQCVFRVKSRDRKSENLKMCMYVFVLYVYIRKKLEQKSPPLNNEANRFFF